jgi:hypothetical protein
MTERAVLRRCGLQRHHIHFGTFDFAFYLVVGPYDRVEEYVSYKFNDSTPPLLANADQGHYAPRGRVFSRHGYCPIVWVPRAPRTPREHATLAHELLHVVVILMNWAALPLGADSEEAYCHALGHAVAASLESLRKKPRPR